MILSVDFKPLTKNLALNQALRLKAWLIVSCPLGPFGSSGSLAIEFSWYHVAHCLNFVGGGMVQTTISACMHGMMGHV